VAAARYAQFAFPAIAATGLGRRLLHPTIRFQSAEAVSLTFDDGPQAQSTPRLLDLLDSLDVRATFFLVGEQVDADKALARDVAARGHEVACHGYRHRNHLVRGPKETRRDLEAAKGTIEDACGVRLRFFRPPFGVFNSASWRLCDELGWTRVLWSRWTRDWEPSATASLVADRATSRLEAGEIVLLHDADTYSARRCYEATIGAVPQIVATLRKRGLRPVRLSDGLPAAL
jgi:peptidoglycan/xylan/chitin deacetylase (PgdA/CDA1 family)